MAQRTEKEETEFKVVPETITLCVKCGVASNSAPNNLCHKCLSATTAVTSLKNHVIGEKSARSTSPPSLSPQSSLNSAQTSDDLKDEVWRKASPEPMLKKEVNRCFCCRRKVGLTGFRCRCGELFCGGHRYSDRHDCSFDYKTAGREAIAKENPVIKAAKIVKI